MPSTILSQTVPATRLETLAAGMFSGLIAGIAMGIIYHGGANVMPLIGALYGAPTVAGGWVGHLVTSVVLGTIYGYVASRPAFAGFNETLSGALILGVVYATLIGIINGGLILPIAFNLLGFHQIPDPILPIPGALGAFIVVLSIGLAHIVYGIVLGATFRYVATLET